MIKTLNKYIDVRLLKLIAILSGIFCISFNFPIFIAKFSYMKSNMVFAISQIIMDAVFVYGFCFILFFGLSITRISLIIGSVILFFTASIAFYYFFFFGISPTKNIIAGLFGSDIAGIYKSVSLRLAIFMIFSVFLCLYTIKYFGYSNTKSFWMKILCALSLLLSVNIIISPLHKRLRNYIPSGYLRSGYIHVFNKSTIQKKVKDKNIKTIKSKKMNKKNNKT